MSGFKFNPSQPGLRKTLKEYEELALRYVWSMGEKGATSRPIHETVNSKLGSDKSISRASIIIIMNKLFNRASYPTGKLREREATTRSTIR